MIKVPFQNLKSDATTSYNNCNDRYVTPLNVTRYHALLDKDQEAYKLLGTDFSDHGIKATKPKD